ncbi:MAG: hypothetical protein ACOYOO_11385 [Saprospiraceae bacterium]|jgi:hypothetical protein
MARKLKLTGFARFFILMLILAPVAYIIASYANGEDGIQNIKRLIGIEQPAEQAPEDNTRVPGPPEEKAADENMPDEIQALKDSLMEKEAQIQELQKEIKALKGTRR